MRETRFSKSRIEEIMEGLQTIAAQLRRHAAAARKVVAPLSLRPAEFRELAALSARRSLRAKEALARLGGDPERVLQLGAELDEIERAIAADRVRHPDDARRDRIRRRDARRRDGARAAREERARRGQPATRRLDREEVHEPRVCSSST